MLLCFWLLLYAELIESNRFYLEFGICWPYSWILVTTKVSRWDYCLHKAKHNITSLVFRVALSCMSLWIILIYESLGLTGRSGKFGPQKMNWTRVHGSHVDLCTHGSYLGHEKLYVNNNGPYMSLIHFNTIHLRYNMWWNRWNEFTPILIFIYFLVNYPYTYTET